MGVRGHFVGKYCAHIGATTERFLPIPRRTVRFRRPVLHVQLGNRWEKTFGRQAGQLRACKAQPCGQLRGCTYVYGTQWGSSTAGPLNNRTKRSIVDNARRGIAPPPRAWSIEKGGLAVARTPLRVVPLSSQRDQEAARSNRREALSSVPVTSQWHAQDGAGQPARTAWPPRRHPSRGSS